MIATKLDCRGFAVRAAATLLCTLLPLGCGSDSDDGSGSGGAATGGASSGGASGSSGGAGTSGGAGAGGSAGGGGSSGSAGSAGSAGTAGSGGGGSKAFFFDDFSSGDFSNTMGGFSWSPNKKVQVTSGHGQGDKSALRFEFGPDASGDDSFAELRFGIGRNLGEIWLEFDIYYPTGSEGLGSARYEHRDDVSSDNNKFLRLWRGKYSGSFHYGCSTRPTSSGSGNGNSRLFNEYSAPGKSTGPYNSGGVSPFVTDTDPGTVNRGKWAQIRMHFRVASSKNDDGLMEWWIDGKQVYKNDTLPIYPGNDSDNYIDNGYVLGWANSGFTELTYIYIDNFSAFDVNPGW